MTYMRETPFNMRRAQLCASECGKKMAEIEAFHS